ncbi:unnamed protein product [Peniophora sp. CBMAI 1063]|nr:unnamed protein product [Peniophora sp. CBMAI 1063]
MADHVPRSASHTRRAAALAPCSALALGSLAVQAPMLTPRIVHVDAPVCQDLSVFKELMNEYRKLDDAITMRMNRTTAQFRDRDREGHAGKGSVQDQACEYLWRDLVENWKRRESIIEYCVGVVDKSAEEKRVALQQDPSAADERMQRRIRAEMYAQETKRNQVHNELAVEKIVRNRSHNVFTGGIRTWKPG